MEQPHYIVGLDLGQAADYTALAVLECPPCPEPPALPVYSLRHLQRFHLGTPYTAIVPAVAKIVQAEPLKGHCRLVVDQTGVGRAVVDLLRSHPCPCPLVPVTITAGSAATLAEDGSGWRVPKKDLVSCALVLLESRRLMIARSLPDVGILVKELQTFGTKITAAMNETFSAREGEHDDLVLAVALACWWATRGMIRPFTMGESKHKSPVEEAPPGVYLT